MNAERQLVSDAFASVFLGSPSLPVWEWADENVFLDEKQSAELPRYNSAETPWNREIQDAIRDTSVNEVSVMKSSQTGVTEGLFNGLRYMPLHMPGNALYCINSENKARDVFKTRLTPSIEFLAADRLTGDSNDITSLIIRLKNMVIRGAGSGTSSPFRETWYRVVILDEIEDHEVSPDGSSYDLVKSRFATVANYTLYVIGKPQMEGGIIHDCYLRGSQERWIVPCPRCEGEIELRFEQLRFRHSRDHLGEWDLSRVLASTYYQCQLCNGHIQESEKYSMVLAGFWQPAPRNERERLKGQVVVHEPGCRSFHVSDLYSPFPQVTWGKLAVKWVSCAEINVNQAKQDDFRKNHLGRPTAPRHLHIIDSTIEALRGGYVEQIHFEILDPETGEIRPASRTQLHGAAFGLCYDRDGKMVADLPVDPIFLTVAVDKQESCLKYTVICWQRDGQGWLVDFGQLANETELLALRKRPYRYRDPETGRERTHTIYGGVFDRGFRRRDVYKCCRQAQRGGWRLYPVLGWGGHSERYTSQSLAEKADTLSSGQTIRYYTFHDHSVKVDFYFGTVQDRTSPRLWLPTPVPQEIIIELTSEYWDGEKNRFVHPDDAAPNDYGDCLKMQFGVVWPILSGSIVPEKAT